MAGGMRIVTNVAALNAVVANTNNSNSLSKSLERLSTGLKINSAKDNASGLAIADQLKTQASTLTQAIDNGNQANSLLLIADKAIEEQVNILDQIKQKATSAAQDGQSLKTRNMLQSDINRLMEELDNIANTTSYNGKQLLSGGFSNQEFQIGNQSNQTIKTTIGATQSSKIGVTRFETGSKITASETVQLTLKNYNGVEDFKYAAVKISYSVNTGLGALAEEINRVSETTGVRASYNVTTTGVFSIKAGSTNEQFAINGVLIGKINYQNNDQNGALVGAINAVKDTTGVEASIDSKGKLVLASADGRAVYISGSIGAGSGIGSTMYANFGRLSLVKNSGSDIVISGGTLGGKGASAVGFAGNSTVSQYSMSLRESKSLIGGYEADALGFNGDRFGLVINSQGLSGIFGGVQLSTASGINVVTGYVSAWSQLKDTQNIYTGTITKILVSNDWGSFKTTMVVQSTPATSQAQVINKTAGVTTLTGAMAVMDIVETAILNLDQIRANIGSAQQQIDSTVNNITTTQVNLKAAESVIRDVDFASESSNYSKASILAQSGAYALAQANASTQYVLQLLQ